MELSGSADSILLEGFRLDRRGGCLFRVDQGGMATPVALGLRAIKLLTELVERRGELVSKDAIMAAVWPGRVRPTSARRQEGGATRKSGDRHDSQPGRH
jgi:DNA-binding winged helix-turn-helix (wHTH) protein